VNRLGFDLEGRIGSLDLAVHLETGDRPLVLVGPNGAGKTSVLLMVLGALRPLRGRVELDGEVLFDAERRIDLAPEERGLGYVPQDYGLFPHMTVIGNVAFGLECRHRLRRAERRERALALLEALDVGHLANRLPRSLSGGEGQRVALARALASEPRALLLDEPLAALDASVRRQLREFLPSRLAMLKLPAIVVTHDPADAAALGQDIAVIEAGRLVQRGTLRDLRERPATPFVAELVRSV
jgi:ABC-type sulfate/molybdate transport systems ATPase subunit